MSRELVDTKRELEAAKTDYTRMGWDVVDGSSERVVVERGLRGSWLWHILFLGIVPVVGNLIYSAYRRYDRPEQTVIRVRGAADADPTHATTAGDTVEEGSNRGENRSSTTAGGSDPLDTAE